MMNICVCSIMKCENPYLREFVEHYKNIGVDRIFLYDNNDGDGERAEEVIDDYIRNGFVRVIDVRGVKAKFFGDSVQQRCYNECYRQHNQKYSWFCFFDVDEFLILPEKYATMKEWLSDEKFNQFGMVHVNWKYYGDNGLIRYEDRPLMERFTTPCGGKNPETFFENRHIKTILMGGLSNGMTFCATPHTPLTWVPCCTADGKKKVDSFSPWSTPKYNDDTPYLRHFGTKTIEEYVTVKMRRGFPDQPMDEALKRINLDEFFKRNEWTEEKEKFARELFEKEKNKA